MTREQARAVLRALNALWAVQESLEGVERRRMSVVCKTVNDSLTLCGFPLVANHDGVLIFADGME